MKRNQLGRRLSGAGVRALAGPYQARQACRTRFFRTSTGSRPLPRPATPGCRNACSRAGNRRPEGDLQTAPRWLQPAPLPHGQQDKRRARSSSTSTMMASWSHALREHGSPSSASRREGYPPSGASRSSACVLPKMYNLRMDPYERATLHRTPITTGPSSSRSSGAAAGAGGAVASDLQGISAEADAVELQRRSVMETLKRQARETARARLRAIDTSTSHVGFRCVKRTRAAE